jgi:high-affinity nickel permease
MRRFLVQQRNRIWIKSLYSSTIISLLLYIVIRVFSFDFPMPWLEEVTLFVKVVCTGIFMMVIATTGIAIIYKIFLQRKRYKKAA